MDGGAAHRRQDRLGAAGRPRDRAAARDLARLRSPTTWRRWPTPARRSFSSPPARSRSAATRSACRRGRSSWSRARRPPPSARSRWRTPTRTCSRRARRDHRADPAHPRRYRGAPPLSQCPAHDRDAARPQGDAGRQRERHGGDSEIRYGDNDRLSARVASMMSADCLVLLSDIDGLYTAPPGIDPRPRRIPTGGARSRRRSRRWRATPAPSCRRAA